MPTPIPIVTSETVNSIPMDTSWSASEEDYYQEKHKKDYIIIHYTAGSTATGAWETLKQDDGVMVPYIIDKDGTIYRTFNPEYWAYSLGVKGAQYGYEKGHFDKKGVAIEVVAEGTLVKKPDDKYYWWPNNYNTLYKGGYPIEGDLRGFQYHADFTPKQNGAVCSLVNYLCDMFDIPKRLLPHEKKDVVDLAYMDKFRGVCSHINFRQDKWDTPSFFPVWESLLQYGFTE